MALIRPKRRVSTGKALAFWLLLGLTMVIVTRELGAIVERAADHLSATIEHRAPLFG